MTDTASQRREFLLLLERSGMSQAAFARKLGVNTMTVNRWASEREDAIAVPFYALNFLRIFLMLPEAARARIPDKPKPPKKSKISRPTRT